MAETAFAEQTKPEHQMVLYDVCGRDFKWDNIYAMGGLRPNAKHIARQYDCEIEFRESQYRKTGNINFFHSYLERFGIGRDGSCLSAVLIGNNREKLAKTRTDIHRSCGATPFDVGAIDISDKRSLI